MVITMSDIRDFLIELQQRGIKLALEGDSLRSRSAPGAIDADTAAQLRARKAEIVEFLRERGRGDSAPECDLAPVPRDRPLPLSSSQRGLWFIDQLGGSAQYIVASAPILLREAIDRAALQSAIDTIVARHESLRTVFANVDGEPWQRVLPPRSLAIVDHDLSGLSEEEQRRRIDRLNQEHSSQPFDLERDLMLRVALLRLAEQRWVVLVAMHHIAADGWSVGVFQQEFARLYRSARRGEPADLPALPVQYADYASWQVARLAEPRARAKLEHWRQRLDGIAPVHSIPLDRPRPPVKGSAAGRLVQRLDAALTERLKQRARAGDATLFMVLHTALSLVVARWSRADDVVIGTPVSGRSQQKLAPLIGFFANTLVLRTCVNPDLDLDGLLAHVRSRCLEAYEHQDVPFDSVVEALQPERSLSYTPVVQLMFALQQIDCRALTDELDIELLSGQQAGSMFDLDVVAVEDEQGVSLRWTFDRALFDDATVRRMMDALALAVMQLAEAGQTKVADVNLLADADRFQLQAWNDTARDYPRDACLHAVVEAQAACSPERVALICGEWRLSYAEFNGKANALARELIDLGVRPGDVVPVVMRPGIDVPLSFLAVMKAGAAFAPLDIDWPAQRLETALANLGDAPVLTTAPVASLPAGRQTYAVDHERLAVEPDIGLATSAQSPIYVMHTSGSTGAPKAALNRHLGIVNRLSFMSRYFNDGSDEVVLQTTYHCFDSAVWQFFWPMIKGGTSVLPQFGEGFDPGLIAELLAAHRVTMTDFSPALLSLFADHVAEAGGQEIAYPHLRDLIVGGEEMTPALVGKCAGALPAVRLHNFYGASEASIGSICYALPDVVPGTVPIGRPIDNVVVALVDPALRPVPISAPGEILLGGDCVGIGYVGNDEATRRSFIELAAPLFGGTRFYRTGDLARYRDDGQIEFLGRIDSQVKIRGFRVELGEIRIALEAQPRVRQAHVRIDGEGAGKRLLAWLVAERDAGTSDAHAIAAIKAGVAERLPDYMVPSGIALIERMPLTPSGKIDARALPAHVEWVSDTAFVAPSTPHEIALARIWSELFKADDIGANDDFFERGGHSLLATQLVARVRNAMRIELPLRVLFANPQLRELGRWCAEQRRGGVSAVQ